MSRNGSRVLLLVVLLAFLGFGDAEAGHEKTDIVHMDFGGFLIGEIEEMRQARLKLDSDEIGMTSVKWLHVIAVESKFPYEIGMEDGSEYFGSLGRADEPGWMVVTSETAVDTLNMQDVISIVPIDRRFIQRVRGQLNVGFSYAQANDVVQLSVEWLATHQTRDDLITLAANVILNRSNGVTDAQRQDYLIMYQRFLMGTWFVGGAITPQQNLAMGVDLRTPIAALVGLNLIQTNYDVMQLSGGISWNREESTGDEPARDSYEGVLHIGNEYFQHDFPVTSVVANFSAFPSLTISGRYRFEFEASASRELIDDFHTSIRIYGSGDNDPPAEGADERDYGLVMSLGWTY